MNILKNFRMKYGYGLGNARIMAKSIVMLRYKIYFQLWYEITFLLNNQTIL